MLFGLDPYAPRPENAVSHLVERGRTRLAMIAGPAQIACHRDRQQAFKDSLQ